MNVCPHCGYDIQRDAPIILNDFAMMGPLGPLRYRGVTIQLAPAPLILCWSLMKAYPRAMTHDALLERLGSDASGNVIDVYLSRIRKEFRKVGAPIPFYSRKPRGDTDQPRSIAWMA